MRRKLVGTVGVWLLACAALVAADFWEEKDFTAWSEKEVEKMLTDSPWSKKVTIVLGSLREEAGGRFTGGGAGPTGDCGGGGQFQAVRRATVTVTWSSALPIKQALLRREIGIDARIPPDRQQLLTQDEPFYFVAVVGLPPPFASLAAMVDAVKAETMLKRKNQEPITPEEVRIFGDGAEQSVRIMFRFPKTDAITLDDKDVEFITKLGDTDVKKKFKLKDMIFGDQLAL